MADIRQLLIGLADDVGAVVPPVDLAERGRRRLVRRRWSAVLAAGTTVVGVAVAASLVTASPSSAPPAAGPDDGTAAALTTGHWTIGQRPDAAHTVPARLTLAGTDVIAIGGYRDDRVTNKAYRWSTSTRAWSPVAIAPESIGLGDGAIAWTGTSLLVMPGYDGKAQVPAADRALLYHPEGDAWTQTSTLPARVSANGSEAAWNGSQVVVAGAADQALHVELYDPSTDRWTEQTPPIPAHHEVMFTHVLQTPKGTLLWSYWTHSVPTAHAGETSTFSGVDVFRDQGHGWTDITRRWPKDLTPPTAFVVGNSVEIGSSQRFCGSCRGPYRQGQPSSLVDMDTLTVQQLPKGPLDQSYPRRVWTGAAEIAFVARGDAAVRDPKTGWKTLPTAPGLFSYAQPLWTGHELVTMTDDGRLVTFGSQDPAGLPGCGTWTAEPGTSDPAARVELKGVTAAEICSYTRADSILLLYTHPVRRVVAPSDLGRLTAVLQRARSRGEMYLCRASATTATTISLVAAGRVVRFTAGGPGCGQLAGQGHQYPWPPGLSDLLETYGPGS